uniref:Albumin I chain a domain-containing protein n=1 Tax=Medicago truncatula TaxID=3880 RepID=I3SFV5_MEDTR|nr:unknown [Medicago truncatula]
MAYLKFALAAVFLATIFICPMKKVEACAATRCTVVETTVCGSGCGCLAWGIFGGNCVPRSSLTKMVEEHPNLCQSHIDCIKKGNGSFCARYPNFDIEHGWCFTSNVEAERYFEIFINPATNNFLKTVSHSINGNGFLKMPVEIVF